MFFSDPSLHSESKYLSKTGLFVLSSIIELYLAKNVLIECNANYVTKIILPIESEYLHRYLIIYSGNVYYFAICFHVYYIMGKTALVTIYDN